MLTKEKHTRLSKSCQVSWIGMRSIIKKFEETHTVENNRGRNWKISKTLERKLVKNVSKEPNTKTLVNDLARFGTDVSTKTATGGLHRNGLQGCRPRKTQFLKKRHLQARPTFEGQPLEKLWLWTTIPVLSRNGWICSKSQKYIAWVKIIDFSSMPNIIRILSKDVPWRYFVNFLP